MQYGFQIYERKTDITAGLSSYTLVHSKIYTIQFTHLLYIHL